MTLNKDQLAQLDKQLEQQEAEMAGAVHDTRAEFATPGSHGWPEVKDSVEDGDARMMASLDINQLHRNEATLREVREARERIREGSYGVCEMCGNEIPFERLRILPQTRYCVQDEERRERAGNAP